MLALSVWTWWVVFVRVGAALAVLPVFSSSQFPVRLRLGIAAVVSWFIASAMPVTASALPAAGSVGGVVLLLATETAVGLLLGFVGRMLFYALDAAGSILSTQMGLMLASDINPFSGGRTDAPGILLNYLAVTLFLTLDLHHVALAGLQRTYAVLPVGGAGLSEDVLMDVVKLTGGIFTAAVQISAPVMAVSFLVSVIFSLLGRAVQQMNVFAESFAFRTLSGLV
ncbi:MAG: flagellar biosynthetic protein FliR, partial [Verrucomicrobiae bacterium]|nr:flagellar biosynthetic protein FliR [Verrucomicrobiae bacterium]